jgi:hypothetical protein
MVDLVGLVVEQERPAVAHKPVVLGLQVKVLLGVLLPRVLLTMDRAAVAEQEE